MGQNEKFKNLWGGGNGIRASKQFMFSIGKVMLILYMGLEYYILLSCYINFPKV